MSLLGEERERNGTICKQVSALRGNNATESSAIERRTSRPCICSCRPLAVSVYSCNPERMEPEADNKEKMPKNGKNDSDADCVKPAKVKE